MANILVVQEHSLSAFNAAEALQNSENTILTTESLDEALRIVHQGGVDLIVSAAHFQTGSVFDLLKACRLSGPERHIPFLIFSNSETIVETFLNDALATTCRVLGANHYVPSGNLTPQKFCLEVEKFISPASNAYTGKKEATSLHWQATEAMRNRQFAAAERLFKLLLIEMASQAPAFPALDIAIVQNELARAQDGQGKTDEADKSRNAIPDF